MSNHQQRGNRRLVLAVLGAAVLLAPATTLATARPSAPPAPASESLAAYQAPVVKADSSRIPAGGTIGVTVTHLRPGRIVKVFQTAHGVSVNKGEETVNHLGTARFAFHPTVIGSVGIRVAGADQQGRPVNSGFTVTVGPASTSIPAPRPAPTSDAPAPAPVVSCTTTSSGNCIRGGQFCPVASEDTTGTDANGRTYICRDSDNNGHPHWEIP